jgi:hypothetical protein
MSALASPVEVHHDGALQHLNETAPDWTTATVVYRNAAGVIVGYGVIERDGDGCRFDVSKSPAGWADLPGPKLYECDDAG